MHPDLTCPALPLRHSASAPFSRLHHVEPDRQELRGRLAHQGVRGVARHRGRPLAGPPAGRAHLHEPARYTWRIPCRRRNNAISNALVNAAGMAEALLGALEHSAALAVTKAAAAGGGGGHAAAAAGSKQVRDEVLEFTKTLRTALHNTFRYGQGTRDMAGPEGLTTEQVSQPHYSDDLT